MPICYLNGEYVPLERACVPVMDRGFLFGDGVYEVIPAYGGRLFRLEQHLQRLDRSLAGIRLSCPLDRQGWRQALNGLLAHTDGSDQSIYIQVTRGQAPVREHFFPEVAHPTVFAMATRLEPVAPVIAERGVAAMTLPDIRWSHCDIKAITLLSNVLLRQQARDAGASEAILLRDGEVTEGAASNVFVVLDEVLITPPKGPRLLPGITRDLVLELAAANHVACREEPVATTSLQRAAEIWLTSSTKEVLPVTRLDGAPVGEGRPGAVWRRINDLYQDYKAALREGRADSD
jgi:D-alanine transaminase